MPREMKDVVIQVPVWKCDQCGVEIETNPTTAERNGVMITARKWDPERGDVEEGEQVHVLCRKCGAKRTKWELPIAENPVVVEEIGEVR